ncbi:MAG TPA: hypothetical protein VLM16_02960 [Ginsengibacter sp.]|nr:hypothetical protein [Ginsengibacter sp.]
MTTENDFIEEYKKQLQVEQEEELADKADLIQEFINFCHTKNIILTKEDFTYSHAVGITANLPNLIKQLDSNLVPDKEGLFEFSELLARFETLPFAPGMLILKEYIVLADSLFRRGFSPIANFAPRFIELFWKFNQDNTKTYISLDTDRVRLNDGTSYAEKDFWIGAKLNRDIDQIKDGIVKLRPPVGLTPTQIQMIFENTYAVDVKWTTKGTIKSFQAEEFKESTSTVNHFGQDYYPARYLHAEFDCSTSMFRHFDGAVHFYTAEEYFQRRDSDFNYNLKNDVQIKTLSKKLFKINGNLSVENWQELSSLFFSCDPLIYEYFEGQLPEKIQEMVEVFLKRSKQHGI